MHDDSIPEELIARRAYELWLERGGPLGDDETDWFAARYELEAEQALRRGRSGRPCAPVQQ